jgi:hypothetical protein
MATHAWVESFVWTRLIYHDSLMVQPGVRMFLRLCWTSQRILLLLLYLDAYLLINNQTIIY